MLAIGRQFGKSLLAINQVLDWFFNVPNCKIGWVSPIYKQSKKVYKDIENAFANDEHIFKNKNGTELTFKGHNNSTIEFFSAERYDNIRGFTFDFLVCDEFAFMDSEAWSEVLRATVLVKGKKVLLLSTPKGRNHFHQIFNLESENPQYKSFKMTSYDNPIINPTEIDDAKATLPDHIFRQEYLAEFIDGGAGMFNDLSINDFPELTDRMFGGLDIGRADDYTVLTIYNEFGEMVYIQRWNHDTWNNIISKVVFQINKYNCHTYVEVNGIGDPIFEQIKSQVTDSNLIQPFVTTSKSKQEIIEQLVVANQRKEVTFKNEEWLHKELSMFTYVYNPKSKSVSYSAPSGFHDDGVMSSAIGYNAFKKLKMQGVYTYG
ncbi:Terminase-like family [uncultured Caudovirales phage]|uniref:Terminase-like family n=1 Tax=uncultured Caudovirales phage TaxID=2100421 RepID=A0A6J7WNM8_9CAUD|nr:Terminase-like family [uncultured Caudovirales phage]